MKPIYHYSTVSESLNNLNKMGFTYDFNINEGEILKNPHIHEVAHVYRYEGDSDPGDQAIVYGIQSTSGKKGVFVSGYSAKSSSEAARIIAKLCIDGSGECKI
jgi:hypothetical protein